LSKFAPYRGFVKRVGDGYAPSTGREFKETLTYLYCFYNPFVFISDANNQSNDQERKTSLKPD
jgi:hypothetical protein